MNYILRPLFCLAFLSSFNTLAAPTGLKIGHVNLDAAIAKQYEAQNYIKEVDKLQADLNAEEQKADALFEEQVTKYRNSMAKLGEKARADEEARLSTMYRDQKQGFANRRLKLEEDHRQKAPEFQNKNRLLVESLGKKGNYDIIIYDQALAYISDDLKKNDLTEELVTQYNKAYPVKATPAAKTAPKAPTKPGKK